MANFNYNPVFSSVVAQSSSTFTRTFQHRDWVDGQDLVQAGDTPEEPGFNVRFNSIETDLDAIKADLAQAYKLIGDLRSALATALLQIRDELNKKTDKAKEGKEGKEGKDIKEKDGKESKDKIEGKELKDGKEGKDDKEGKDGKEGKEGKEHKDGKEGGKDRKENKEGAKESNREVEDKAALPPPFASADPEGEAVGRAFIRPEERPRVGEQLVRRDERAA